MLGRIKNWLGRNDRGTRNGRNRIAARLGMEVLEGREVPAALNIVNGILTYTAGNNVANFLTVSFDPATNRYTVTDREAIDLQSGVLDGVGDLTPAVSFSAANINSLALSTMVLSTGDLNDTVNVLSTVDGTAVYAGEGDDIVNVGGYVVNIDYYGGNLNGIRAFVTVHGQGGNDELWVNDWYNALPATYTVTNFQVGRDGTAGVRYLDTVELLRLNENQGHSTVNVMSTSAATAVHISLKAGGADTVNVGGVYNSLDAIRGPVSVAGQVGQDGTVIDRLNINDQSESDRHEYTIAADYYTRPDYSFPLVTGTVSRDGAVLVTYTGGLAALTVNAGGGNDWLDVQSTAALAPVTVNAGGGSDLITVGYYFSVDKIRGPLAVNGGAGSDDLFITDGRGVFFSGPGTLKRNGVTLLTYTGIEQIWFWP